MATPAINHSVPRHEHNAPILIVPPPQRPSLLGWLRHLRRNAGLRAIAIAIAVVLWIFVNAGQHGSLETFMVPILYRGLPPGFLITNQHPDNVHVQISGPRTLLSLIDPARLSLKIDLTNAGIGQMQFGITPESFAVPRGTDVTSLTPSQVTLDVDRIVERNVPVKLTLSGAVATGYEVKGASVTPATVTIKGPSKDVARIDAVATEPLAIDKATADDVGTVDLAALPGMVRLETEAVTANVSVGPILVEKQFRLIQVMIRNSAYRSRIVPSRVSLTLHGPVLTLAKLDPKGIAYVDADSVPPGFYDLPVQLNLPDGVELVKQTPEQVRLIVYHQKLGAN
ncbi:MAG TPA: CdaR family protein [Candidatus Binataceae bacterium]|nr:CdaR family protein [Candidatus Binataceae bacterium]